MYFSDEQIANMGGLARKKFKHSTPWRPRKIQFRTEFKFQACADDALDSDGYIGLFQEKIDENSPFKLHYQILIELAKIQQQQDSLYHLDAVFEFLKYYHPDCMSFEEYEETVSERIAEMQERVNIKDYMMILKIGGSSMDYCDKEMQELMYFAQRDLSKFPKQCIVYHLID